MKEEEEKKGEKEERKESEEEKKYTKEEVNKMVAQLTTVLKKSKVDIPPKSKKNELQELVLSHAFKEERKTNKDEPIRQSKRKGTKYVFFFFLFFLLSFLFLHSMVNLHVISASKQRPKKKGKNNKRSKRDITWTHDCSAYSLSLFLSFLTKYYCCNL